MDRFWNRWSRLADPGAGRAQDLRRTRSAILQRHQNGSRWRAMPADLGPRWRAGQVFIRWARLSMWERLLGLARERGAWHSFPRRYQHPGPPEGGRGGAKGGSQVERSHREALGRSRRGYGTKAYVIADGARYVIVFRIPPGQAHELRHVAPLLDNLPGVPRWVVGDRGYTSHRFPEHIWSMGARPAIPPQHDAPVACSSSIYAHHNRVERLWARLEERRTIATRYEKTARSSLGRPLPRRHSRPRQTMTGTTNTRTD